MASGEKPAKVLKTIGSDSDPIIAGLGVSMKEMEGKARFDAMYRNFDTVL